MAVVRSTTIGPEETTEASRPGGGEWDGATGSGQGRRRGRGSEARRTSESQRTGAPGPAALWRHGHRRGAVSLLPALLLVSACSSTSPAGGGSGSDVVLPSSAAGVELEQATLAGSEFIDAGDPFWQEILTSLPADPDEIGLGLAWAPEESGLDLQLVALSVPAVDWSGRLQSWAVRAGGSGTVTIDDATIAGKVVTRVSGNGEPSVPTSHFYLAGDVLYALIANENLAQDLLAQLPDSPATHSVAVAHDDLGQARLLPGQSEPKATLRIVTVSNPTPSPYCVYQPRRLRFTAFTPELIADPTVLFTSTSQSGPIEPSPLKQSQLALHLVQSWNGGRDLISISALSAATLEFGELSMDDEIWHCLTGEWDDGGRTLDIVHGHFQPQSTVTAAISSGTLSCGEAGTAFSGTISGNTNLFMGNDMKVCNPEPCVTAGLLPNTTLRPFTAAVLSDGRHIVFEWDRELFEITYDAGGNATSCAQNGTEVSNFSISR